MAKDDTTSPNGADDLGRLVVRGPDQPGIVAAVSGILYAAGGNIVTLDQFSSEEGRFFQRTVFSLANLSARIEDLKGELADKLAGELGLSLTLTEAHQRKRVAVLVSRSDHCLLDLLWRQRRGELAMDINLVISNHPDLSQEVRRFGIPFVHIPVPKDGKTEAEKEQLNLLKGNVDLVVMARYMQILSGAFLEEVGAPVINIHHSFLPAFTGGSPYQRAKERGVKLIGATAHYATEDLDEGPIIEQDVVRVSHTDTVDDLRRRGADVERQVLSRAVAWHCADRVIRDGNATVVL